MQLMYAAPPLLMQWLASFKEFPPHQGSELHHRPGGRETDAKGLIVKNIAGRFEQLPSMKCGKARDVDPL